MMYIAVIIMIAAIIGLAIATAVLKKKITKMDGEPK